MGQKSYVDDEDFLTMVESMEAAGMHIKALSRSIGLPEEAAQSILDAPERVGNPLEWLMPALRV